MKNGIVVAAGFVLALALPSHASAQNSDSLLPALKSMPAPAIADTGAHAWSTRPAQSYDWKRSASIPGSADRSAASATIHVPFARAPAADALRRLPFYVTAPYWLPRSRTFGKADDRLWAPQPATTHGALINDIATLVHSAASN
ncbi:MAG TPA: hypothetical protein VME63_01170 [Dyella sp.]|uniref:hypothetical protein n=1 Tax=Dyella sp. TaxID=1869338 RepID=UPI002C268A25|nr:hypothetical protein [Dyella sp.]HTV83988.1 hypothetical protein [Dyella sp.]